MAKINPKLFASIRGLRKDLASPLGGVDLSAVSASKLRNLHDSVASANEAQARLARAKLERENRMHDELFQSQQEQLVLQKALLKEAQKDKYKNSLLLLILGCLLGAFLSKYFL
jgi:hypothetical protein